MVNELTRRHMIQAALAAAMSGVLAHPGQAMQPPGAMLDSLVAVGRAALSAGVVPFDAGSVARLGPDYAQTVRDDFAQGRTVTVDGWLLSQTEARLCAHFAQEQSRINTTAGVS